MATRTRQAAQAKSPTGGAPSPLSALVSEEAPASKWIPHFRTRREALEHFASAHASRHRLIGVQRTCFSCGGQPAESVATYRWSARFNKGLSFGGLDALLLLFGHLRVSVVNETLSFNTLHAVCAPCAMRLWLKRLAAKLLRIIGTLMVLVFALGAGVMWGVFFTAVRVKDRDAGLEGAWITTLLLLTGAGCLVAARYLNIPSNLRFLASRPFFSSTASFARARR